LELAKAELAKVDLKGFDGKKAKPTGIMSATRLSQ
jgi:hypothetical protein